MSFDRCYSQVRELQAAQSRIRAGQRIHDNIESGRSRLVQAVQVLSDLEDSIRENRIPGDSNMVLIPATLIENEVTGLLHTTQDLYRLQVAMLAGIAIHEDDGEDFDYEGNLNQ